MGCQKKIAKQIIQQGGDYILNLKGNQGLLHDDITTYFTFSLSPAAAAVTYDGGHGRVETRAARVTEDIAWLKENHAWSGLRSIVAITATREIGNKVTEEARYFSSAA